VLLTAEGCGTAEIMRRVDASKTTVWRWQERFMIEGVAGLLRDKTRPSRIPPLDAEVEAEVVSRTLAEPMGETTHWTAPATAKLSAISVSSVQRIWRKHGLQPHRTRQFKLSNDPLFAAKLPTSSASMSIRRRMPSCCRSTKRARSRRSIARSPACR
jgi:transposase